MLRNKMIIIILAYLTIVNALLDSSTFINITDTNGDCEMFVSDLTSKFNHQNYLC